MMEYTLSGLAARIHGNAVAHGFWPDRRDENEALETLKRMAEDFVTPEDQVRVVEAVDLLRPLIQEGRNFGEMMALVMSEAVEAMEEHRAGQPVRYYSAKRDGVDLDVYKNEGAWYYVGTTMRVPEGATMKPEGAASELADVIIRVLDTMHSLGVNVDDVVGEKMAYNEGRPYKHGKAY